MRAFFDKGYWIFCTGPVGAAIGFFSGPRFLGLPPWFILLEIVVVSVIVAAFAIWLRRRIWYRDQADRVEQALKEERL